MMGPVLMQLPVNVHHMRAIGRERRERGLDAQILGVRVIREMPPSVSAFVSFAISAR
jgi:hypothetical protein